MTWERPQGGHNPQQAHSAPAHTDSHSGQNGYGDSAQSGYTAQPAQNTHSTQTNQHGNSQYQHNSQPNTYNQNQHSTSSSGGLLGQLSAGVAMLGGKNNKHGSGYGQGSVRSTPWVITNNQSHGYGGQGSSTSKLASTAGGALMSAFDMGVSCVATDSLMSRRRNWPSSKAKARVNIPRATIRTKDRTRPTDRTSMALRPNISSKITATVLLPALRTASNRNTVNKRTSRLRGRVRICKIGRGVGSKDGCTSIPYTRLSL